MKKISLMAMAFSLATIACVAISPAKANNNQAYLNNLAMQMYLQNQASAYNPYAYNPYAYSTTYAGGTTPWAAGATAPWGAGAAAPWAAGAMPYGYAHPYNACNPYYGTRNTYFHHGWWR